MEQKSSRDRVSALLLLSIPTLSRQFEISSLERPVVESEFKIVFLLWLNPALTILKKFSSLLGLTAGSSLKVSLSTSESTLGAGKKLSLGTSATTSAMVLY